MPVCCSKRLIIVFFCVLLASCFHSDDSRPDDGDTLEDATVIEPGDIIKASFKNEQDVDVFSITLTSTQTLSVYTTGIRDTLGELIYYDDTFDSLSTLSFADDIDPTCNDLNFQFTSISLPAGTYYVKVSIFPVSETGPGSYRLHTVIGEIPDFSCDQIGDSIQTALALPAPAGLQPAINNGSDIDMFEVTCTLMCDITAFTTRVPGISFDTDTHGRLLDALGGVLAENDDIQLSDPPDPFNDNLNFSVTATNLAPGNYYIEVSGFDLFTAGFYGLTVDITQ